MDDQFNPNAEEPKQQIDPNQCIALPTMTPIQGVCPWCGYCPTCDRAKDHYIHPYYPTYPTYPWYQGGTVIG